MQNTQLTISRIDCRFTLMHVKMTENTDCELRFHLHQGLWMWNTCKLSYFTGKYLMFFWKQFQKLFQGLDIKFWTISFLHHWHKLFIWAVCEWKSNNLNRLVTTSHKHTLTNQKPLILPLKLLQKDIQVQILLGVNEGNLRNRRILQCLFVTYSSVMLYYRPYEISLIFSQIQFYFFYFFKKLFYQDFFPITIFLVKLQVKLIVIIGLTQFNNLLSVYLTNYIFTFQWNPFYFFTNSVFFPL